MNRREWFQKSLNALSSAALASGTFSFFSGTASDRFSDSSRLFAQESDENKKTPTLSIASLESKPYPNQAELNRVVTKGLDWLSSQQGRRGGWETQSGYPTAMTALAGIALLCEGSTATQGKYASNINSAIEYLSSKSRPNGLIGDPTLDDHYTYGHGFGMLFLSQILGEEEDIYQRERITDILVKAVDFTAKAQTKSGGWGYVSAKDGNDFDEGSTTITQVQGLRGCRNAGIVVSKQVIDRAIAYIHKCSINGGAGGVQYSAAGGGDRPPISAAAIACLFNAGEYDDKYVPKLMKYCEQKLDSLSPESGMGFWHYAHYYYSQVKYRQGGRPWENYRNRLYRQLLKEADSNGSWTQGYLGGILTTAMNLTMLQLDNAVLPIYQR